MSPKHELDPIRALRHPIWWSALALLVLNDHVLKGAGVLPGAVTGKLSDVAGLIVAPALLAALFRVRSRKGLGLALTAVGGAFALINLFPAAAVACEQVMAALGISWRIWCDPTDLMTLPALGVSAWLVLRTARDAQPRRVFVERALAMAGALACAATSVAPPSAPATSQGKVLASTHGKGAVFVIDSATGRRLAAPDFKHGTVGSVEVRGVLYAVTGQGLRGISLATEKEVMRFEYEKGGLYDIILTDGHRIFMMARGSGKNERLIAVDLPSGKLAWDVAVPGRERSRTSSKQPILAGGLVVVPVGPRLAAFEPGTGHKAWVHEASSSVHWPSVEGPSVFAVDGEGTIISIDLQRGHVLWRHPVGSFEGFEGRYFDGPRFGAGSGVLAFLRGERVIGIAADTRVQRWRGPKVEDLVVGEEIAIVRMEIDGDDYLVALRMVDGKRLWKLNADDWMQVDPTIDDHNGLVLIRPSATELRAYTMANGTLVWRFLLHEGQRAEMLR